MGKPGAKSSAIVSVDVNENGEVRYDAIVRQGSNKDRRVQSSITDLVARKADEKSLSLPADDEEQQTTERTRLALEALLEGKIKSAKPTTLSAAVVSDEPTYIRYTPNPNAPG